MYVAMSASAARRGASTTVMGDTWQRLITEFYQPAQHTMINRNMMVCVNKVNGQRVRAENQI